MTNFDMEKLALKEAYLINYFSTGDNRGNFKKCFEKNIFSNGGIEFNVSETFISVSEKNVIRGLHFQLLNPQAKIVCVIKGRVWDVIVDLRVQSMTYKKWIGVELSDKNNKAIYVPRGFAHGFAALEDETIMLYQCDGLYDKSSDTGILYNEPEIGITWPVKEKEVIQSERDKSLMSLKEYEKRLRVM